MVVQEESITRKEVLCKACGGRMKKAIVSKHSKKFGGFLIASGVGCSLFWIGLVLGVPLLVMGIYMVAAKKPVWVCSECQSVVDRYVKESLTALN
ncbi:MAG: hypothetical protein V3S04_04490 [Candidatus Omnitrophota bacterium]